MSERSPVLRKKPAAALVLAAILVLTGMSFHHGWSSYHQDIELTYTGTVTSNKIGNPHTYIDLDVAERAWKDDRARAYDKVEDWNVVLAPLTRMQNRGMGDTTVLNVGKTVKVVGYPSRTVAKEMRAERIIIGDLSIELR